MTVIIILLILILLAALYIGLIMPRAMAKPDPAPILCDYAHRGLFDNKALPENSMGAFRAAAAHGLGIELDVQLSSDGEVMVFHDYTLSRVCGEDVKLSELTASELSRKKLMGSEYTIPRFADVLREIGGRVPLLVELKGEDLDDSLCWKLAPMLDAYGGEYCVESFNPMYLRWFKRHRPDVVRGQLVTNLIKEKKPGNKFLNFLLSYLFLNILSRPDFIACNGKYQSGPALFICRHIFRAPLFLWTVRHEKVLELNRRRGIYSIFEGFLPR